MKRKTFSFVAILCLFVFLLAACGRTSDGVTTLRLAENQPADFPTAIGVKEFARLIEEKTDGRYKVDVYTGGQLGDEKSVIEHLQLGSIDLARVNGTPLTEFSDVIGVLSLPFLFESAEQKWDVWNGPIGQEILDTFEGARFVGLAFYDNGERSFYNSKRPIRTPADMKGLKIRVQPSELAISIVQSLGASATPMDYGEVYSSIQTGVIDGGENNLPSYYSSNHYGVAKQFTLGGYQSVPEVVLASEKLWNSLSEQDKIAFKEAAQESVAVQRAAWDEMVEESLKEVAENGNELVELEDMDAWRKAVEPVYEKYSGQYQEWIDRIHKQIGVQ
ncbi:TRAP transporter substrate-binding protein [Bacillus sp. FJAT-50079]|uniref:TRAP transporter substrate-binding protein n=1 Tax=Bacillus sp. FJAT-50079 TaxID=2833577 RepID=UPI001BCA13D1|nr:TRAP transporter substrate-binding protein [Bacillus sp. FJAT-50079]MBS4210613.1 TRAP transporter substrate-binding protein [Bacillus sp. FJAT-50079]